MQRTQLPGFTETNESTLQPRLLQSVDEKIEVFVKDPNDLQLDNHALEREWEGYRSIDITADYRVIYREISEGEESVAYFEVLGTMPKVPGVALYFLLLVYHSYFNTHPSCSIPHL